MTVRTSRLTKVLTLVLATASPSGARAEPAQSRQPLERITAAELTDAGVRGTGCSWALRGERGSRLVMIDDRALVKLADGLVLLRPDRGAHDMFPFTFDEWKAPTRDVAITVRKVAGAKRIGTETLGSRTDLVLVQAGRQTLLRGFMACGS